MKRNPLQVNNLRGVSCFWENIGKTFWLCIIPLKPAPVARFMASKKLQIVFIFISGNIALIYIFFLLFTTLKKSILHIFRVKT
jgi:hypothetical protein